MIVYKINVLEELKKKGFSTYKIQTERIFSQNTVHMFRHGDTGINTKTLDKLCELLECQPGEILEHRKW